MLKLIANVNYIANEAEVLIHRWYDIFLQKEIKRRNEMIVKFEADMLNYLMKSRRHTDFTSYQNNKRVYSECELLLERWTKEVYPITDEEERYKRKAKFESDIFIYLMENLPPQKRINLFDVA